MFMRACEFAVNEFRTMGCVFHQVMSKDGISMSGGFPTSSFPVAATWSNFLLQKFEMEKNLVFLVDEFSKFTLFYFGNRHKFYSSLEECGCLHELLYLCEDKNGSM